MTMYDRLRTIDRTSLSSVRMKHSSFAAFIWICLFGAVIAGCFSACGRKNSSTGAHALSVLKYPIIEEPPTLDPARLQDVYVTELLGNVFEGLVTTDSANKIAP